MTPRNILMVSALLVLPWPAHAQTTTTLSAETSDNTSVGTFPQHDNGNVAAGNVSKLDTRSLLYPGATTRIYAHVMPWFCTPGSANCNCSTTNGLTRCNSHILTGYNSNDAVQVKRQVDDMISRGIQGVIIPWYGTTKYSRCSGSSSTSRSWMRGPSTVSAGGSSASVRPSRRSSDVPRNVVKRELART